MEANSIRKRGLPIWEYSSLPAHFRIVRGLPIWKWGAYFWPPPSHALKSSSPKFWAGNRDLPALSETSPYGKGESLFPYGEPDDTAPRFHMVIIIWKWG